VTRLSSLAGLAVAATVLLTGCGSVPGFNPGVGVRVDDATFSMDEVADLSSAYCEAVETQLQEGQMVANSMISQQVAGSLALRSAAEQFAAAAGVAPDAAYAQSEQQLEASIADLTPAQQEAVRRVNLAEPYAQAVQLAVGKQAGSTDAQAALAAGQDEFTTWLGEQDVRIDPRFAVSIDEGTLAPATTELSYSVSDTATRAAATEPDPTYAAELPQSQRCG